MTGIAIVQRPPVLLGRDAALMSQLHGRSLDNTVDVGAGGPGELDGDSVRYIDSRPLRQAAEPTL